MQQSCDRTLGTHRERTKLLVSDCRPRDVAAAPVGARKRGRKPGSSAVTIAPKVSRLDESSLAPAGEVTNKLLSSSDRPVAVFCKRVAKRRGRRKLAADGERNESARFRHRHDDLDLHRLRHWKGGKLTRSDIATGSVLRTATGDGAAVVDGRRRGRPRGRRTKPKTEAKAERVEDGSDEISDRLLRESGRPNDAAALDESTEDVRDGGQLPVDQRIKSEEIGIGGDLETADGQRRSPSNECERVPFPPHEPRSIWNVLPSLCGASKSRRQLRDEPINSCRGRSIDCDAKPIADSSSSVTGSRSNSHSHFERHSKTTITSQVFSDGSHIHVQRSAFEQTQSAAAAAVFGSDVELPPVADSSTSPRTAGGRSPPPSATQNVEHRRPASALDQKDGTERCDSNNNRYAAHRRDDVPSSSSLTFHGTAAEVRRGLPAGCTPADLSQVTAEDLTLRREVSTDRRHGWATPAADSAAVPSRVAPVPEVSPPMARNGNADRKSADAGPQKKLYRPYADDDEQNRRRQQQNQQQPRHGIDRYQERFNVASISPMPSPLGLQKSASSGAGGFHLENVGVKRFPCYSYRFDLQRRAAQDRQLAASSTDGPLTWSGPSRPAVNDSDMDQRPRAEPAASAPARHSNLPAIIVANQCWRLTGCSAGRPQ